MSIAVTSTVGAWAKLTNLHANEVGEAFAESTWLYIIKPQGINSGSPTTLTITRTSPTVEFSIHHRIVEHDLIAEEYVPSFTRCNDAGGTVSHFTDGDDPDPLDFGSWYMLAFIHDSANPDTVKIGIKPWGGAWSFYEVARADGSAGLPDDAEPPILFNSEDATLKSMPCVCAGIALYDRQLLEAELEAITHPLQELDGLRSYWPMDAIVGGQLLDAIGGNHATLTEAGAFSVSTDSPTGYPAMATATLSFTKCVQIGDLVPDGNNGAKTTTVIGRSAVPALNRTLLGGLTFDAFGIPADGTPTSAILTAKNCTVAAAAASAVDCDGIEDFTEGTGTSFDEPADGVTWNTEPDVIADSTTSGLALPTGTGEHVFGEIIDTILALWDAELDDIALRLKRNDEASGTSQATFQSDDADADAWSMQMVWSLPVAAFVSADVDADGTTLNLYWETLIGPGWNNEAITTALLADIEITVTRDGSPVTINGTTGGSPAISVAGQTGIEGIVLSGPIYAGETITITFPAGLIKDDDGRTSAAGTDEEVSNGSTVSNARIDLTRIDTDRIDTTRLSGRSRLSALGL